MEKLLIDLIVDFSNAPCDLTRKIATTRAVNFWDPEFFNGKQFFRVKSTGLNGRQFWSKMKFDFLGICL